MLPIRIEGANDHMVPPKGLEDRLRLHVKRVGNDYYSRWEPTPGELAILNQGGSIEMRCTGVQPVVTLTAVPHCEGHDTRIKISA